jgi:hypothetical protein
LYNLAGAFKLMHFGSELRNKFLFFFMDKVE